MRCKTFSLAEMMIALIILGFGLIVIAVTLPVGLSYSVHNTNRSSGQAAAEYGRRFINGHIRLHKDVWNDSTAKLHHHADIFCPRIYLEEGNMGEMITDYEPVIKVRPLLFPPAISPSGIGDDSPSEYHCDVEEQIALWVSSFGFVYKEYDDYADNNDGMWTYPSIPTIVPFYPRITRSYTPADFDPTQFTPNPTTVSDINKTINSRTSWVSFYRRVFYGPDSDHSLYEFIVVGVVRPTTEHCYPRFEPSPSGAVVYKRESNTILTSLIPIPWLVTFESIPDLNESQYGGLGNQSNLNRNLNYGFVDPPHLQFEASTALGQLLPVGSLIIPAANDHETGQYWGFVPHSPNSLPIYEVLNRVRDGNDYIITVKGNGLYPWVNGVNEDTWPAWIIPPAFKDVDVSGNPLYGKRSPIVYMCRQIMKLPEIE